MIVMVFLSTFECNDSVTLNTPTLNQLKLVLDHTFLPNHVLLRSFSFTTIALPAPTQIIPIYTNNKKKTDKKYGLVY